MKRFLLGLFIGLSVSIACANDTGSTYGSGIWKHTINRSDWPQITDLNPSCLILLGEYRFDVVKNGVYLSKVTPPENLPVAQKDLEAIKARVDALEYTLYDPKVNLPPRLGEVRPRQEVFDGDNWVPLVTPGNKTRIVN